MASGKVAQRESRGRREGPVFISSVVEGNGREYFRVSGFPLIVVFHSCGTFNMRFRSGTWGWVAHEFGGLLAAACPFTWFILFSSIFTFLFLLESIKTSLTTSRPAAKWDFHRRRQTVLHYYCASIVYHSLTVNLRCLFYVNSSAIIILPPPLDF